MVEISIGRNKHSGLIILKPNQSANWQTVLIIISLISFVIFVIALYMASIGAWLVLPFSSLEIIALVLANYYCIYRNSRQEVINFSIDTVTVEKGIRQPSQTICFQRHWTKTKIIAPSHPRHPKKIALYSKNQQVIVGNFLNEDDRELLSKALKEMLCKTS